MKIKNKLLLGLSILSVGLILSSCGGSSSTSSDNSFIESGEISSLVTNSSNEQAELKFKSAILTPTENEGELRVKAEINGSNGKIYYVISDEEKDVTPDDIVNAEGFIYSNVSESTLVEEVVQNLEAGKTYYAYFVIKYNEQYSVVQKKTATTYKNSVDMGEGTVENPFKIYSIEDLEHVGLGVYDAYNLDWSKTSCYELQNDIDLSTKYGENLSSWVPLSLNTDGIFDGNGYTISNMYINNSNSDSNLGLFQQINTGALVKNLTISDATIISNGYNDKPRLEDLSTSLDGYTASGIYVGTLSGDVKGTVENCHVKNATLNVTGSRVGGITGRLYSDTGTSSLIKNCSVDDKTTIKGYSRLGGIVGLVDAKSSTVFEQSIIEDVEFSGTIEGKNNTFETTSNNETINVTVVAEYIGGIVGYYRSASIKNAVSTGTIKGYRHVGGIVGFQQYNSKVGDHNTTIDNVLFNGNLYIGAGTNVGPIVGNRSTSNTTETDIEIKVQVTNAYFTNNAKMYVNETEIEFNSIHKNAKFGESVTLDDTWYNNNLTSFDFVNTWTLNDNNIPSLKK